MADAQAATGSGAVAAGSSTGLAVACVRDRGENGLAAVSEGEGVPRSVLEALCDGVPDGVAVKLLDGEEGALVGGLAEGGLLAGERGELADLDGILGEGGAGEGREQGREQ